MPFRFGIEGGSSFVQQQDVSGTEEGAGDGDTLTLAGLVATPDGQTVYRAKASAPRQYADALGRAVAKQLEDQGALAIISALAAS